MTTPEAMTAEAMAAGALAAAAVLLAGLGPVIAKTRVGAALPVPSRIGRGHGGGVAVGACLAGGGVVGATTGRSSVVVLVAATVLVAVAARRMAAARRRSAEAARTRAQARELCRALAAELRAGLDPCSALAAAAIPIIGAEAEAAGSAAAARVLRPVVATARAGGEVAASLTAAASEPGAGGLARVAVCWTVAGGTGAGLAQALDRVADGLDADEDARREVQAQLAGPRATAALLSGLPVVGVVMGSGLGGNPIGALTGTGWGRCCLAGAVGLTVAGRWWTGRLARAASP